MKKTELLQEVRKMRFEEAYEGWQKGRLTQEEAAKLLGICDRTYRRYLVRYEEQGMEGLVDRLRGGLLCPCRFDKVTVTLQYFIRRTPCKKLLMSQSLL